MYYVINWYLKLDYLNALKLTCCFKLILWTRIIEIIDFDIVSFEVDFHKLILNLLLLVWLKRFGTCILDSKIWYAWELYWILILYEFETDKFDTWNKLFKNFPCVLDNDFSWEGSLTELYANDSKC